LLYLYKNNKFYKMFTSKQSCFNKQCSEKYIQLICVTKTRNGKLVALGWKQPLQEKLDIISKNMRANNLDCSSNSTCSPELNLLSFDILVKSSGVFLQRKQRPTIKRIHWNFCCQTDILIDIFNNYLRLRSTTTPTGKLHVAISKCIYNI
jgi:hypothetical protein